MAVYIFFTILILCFACFIKFWELDDLKNKRSLLVEKARFIVELANTIRATSWSELKSKEKIFNRNINIKNLVEKIAQKFSLQKVLFRINNEVDAREKIMEIKFNVSDECLIYKFLDALWRESTGIIVFESIKILKSKPGELLVKIKCKIFSFDEKEAERSIEITEQKSTADSKSINLFNSKRRKKHNLLCILDNYRAYVNNAWYGVGDKIDDWEVLNIYKNSIEIQLDNKKSTVTLGTSW